MPLPRVVSYVFIYCCESGTIKTDYRLRQKHRQNQEKQENPLGILTGHSDPPHP